MEAWKDILPSEIVFIGDKIHRDVLVAKRFGLHAVHFVLDYNVRIHIYIYIWLFRTDLIILYCIEFNYWQT